MRGGLGLGLAIAGLGASGSPKAAMAGATFWSLAGTGNLQPDATGTITADYNMIWDLDGDDFMPQATPVNDGFWEVIDLGSSNYEIQPRNV